MTENRFALRLSLAIIGLVVALGNTAFGMKAETKKAEKKTAKKACNHSHHEHKKGCKHEHKKPAATLITLVQGDITQQEFDDPEHSALVNAANESLIGGAGVARAIQDAGGDRTVRALRSIKMKRVNGVDIRCKVGGTVLTTAGDMAERDDNTRVRWVISAVGPDLSGNINRSVSEENQNDKKEEYLRCASRNVLNRASDNELKAAITTVAYTALSTNIFGYNVRHATPVMINAVIEWLEEYLEEHGEAHFEEIRFVVRDEKTYNVYRKVLNGLVGDGRLHMHKAIHINNSDLLKLRFRLAN